MDLMGLVPYKNTYGDTPEPVTKHTCEVEPEEDEIQKRIPGNSLGCRLRRYLLRQRILSMSHYYAQTCLKSTTAINQEIIHHLDNFPRMIHPFSPFRNYWDTCIALFTICTIVLTPFLNAFYLTEDGWSMPIILSIDLMLLLDVVLNFFTGYFEQKTKTVKLDPKIVSSKYISSYFLPDILSAIPIEIIDLLLHGDKHLSWYCSAFNFIKILRIRNVIAFVNTLHKAWHFSLQKVKILELVIIIGLTLHWSACLVYYVPNIMREYKYVDISTWRSWILNKTMTERESNPRKYILCLNRAMISLVGSSHFLHVVTEEDMVVNFVLAVFGKMGFIYLLCQFIQLVTTFHSSEKERLKVLQQLQEYMQYKELPCNTQKRLRTYCNYWYKKNLNRDRQILYQVSEPLREELILHNYTKLLETVDIFKYLPQPATVQLVNYIKGRIFLSSDVIVKAGTQGEHLYFVASGTVAVYTSLGKEVCHLSDGSYFGEIALVMEHEQRIATVIAIETCEILVIPREAFQQVIEPYPNLQSHLQKIALRRLERTLLLDEIYRVEEPHPKYINISNIRGKRRE